MKTICILCLALFSFGEAEEVKRIRRRRGSFVTSFPLNSNRLQIGGVDVAAYELGHYDVPAVPFANSNAIDKPVDEPQEVVPAQSMGNAIIPYYPPPATPVNAAAANVPARMGAVFLGSGSLGVIDLGGGAYAIGSGSLGYSERRSNPRASAMHPLLPPLQAAPDLIPAAVNNPEAPQLLPPTNFNLPPGAPLPTDQNGYEYLPPDRVGFGDPLPPRPIKITQAFATPSALQVQPPQLPSTLPIIQTQIQTLPSAIQTQPQTLAPPIYQPRRVRQRVSVRTRYGGTLYDRK